MPPQRNTLSVIRGNRTAFIALTVVLLLLELGIFAVAALQSGERYKLQFLDKNGGLVYEADGKTLDDFNLYQFKMTHGSLENYQRKLVRIHIPFPFRAWFVAAFGIPLGMFLFFGFILRAYTSLFYGEEEKREAKDSQSGRYETRLEKIIGRANRLSIFVIAALAFLAVIAYWILPNLVIYLGEVSMDTILRFKWAILLVGLAAFGLVMWIIYLKYLLAKQSMNSRMEVDKHRLELEYKYNVRPQLLEHRQNAEGHSDVVGWDADEVIEEAKVNEGR